MQFIKRGKFFENNSCEIVIILSLVTILLLTITPLYIFPHFDFIAEQTSRTLTICEQLCDATIEF